MLRPPTNWRRWLAPIVKLLVIVVVVWAVHRTLYQAWNQLRDYQWTIRWGWLWVGAAIYAVGFLPAGLFWFHSLRVLGQTPHLFETLRAYYIGHLGKYVPGKAMVIVLRTALVRSNRVATTVAAASVFLETLTMMAVGAFLAALFLAIVWLDETKYLVVAVALMVFAVVPTLPPVFRRAIAWAVRRTGGTIPADRFGSLGFRTLALGWVSMIVLWGIFGLSYWAVLRSLGLDQVDPIVQLPRLTASVALATVAGFALLALPGGLGVREAALATLMIPYLATLSPHAELISWASAALLRVVWVFTEAFWAAILYALGRRAGLSSDTCSENLRTHPTD